VLREGFLLLYCAAVGFVASGVAASFYKMVTLEPAGFRLLGESWWGGIVTFFFCAITGPAIVTDIVIRNRMVHNKALGGLFAGVFIAGLWSVCSGIVVLQVALQIRSLA
jgi:hypothetical protein